MTTCEKIKDLYNRVEEFEQHQRMMGVQPVEKADGFVREIRKLRKELAEANISNDEKRACNELLQNALDQLSWDTCIWDYERDNDL